MMEPPQVKTIAFKLRHRVISAMRCPPGQHILRSHNQPGKSPLFTHPKNWVSCLLGLTCEIVGTHYSKAHYRTHHPILVLP
jgi:hypothetical protein